MWNDLFFGRFAQILIMLSGAFILGYWLHWWRSRDEDEVDVSLMHKNYEALEKLQAWQKHFDVKTSEHFNIYTQEISNLKKKESTVPASLKEFIQNLQNKITIVESAQEKFATKDELSAINIPTVDLPDLDLSKYALKSDLPTNKYSSYSSSSSLSSDSSSIDLSSYVKKIDLLDYAKRRELRELNLSDYKKKVDELEKLVADLNKQTGSIKKRFVELDENGVPTSTIIEHLSIGHIEADSSNKDDLKLINGIGPFIEEKINALGIYTFEQVSHLNEKDIEIITDAIEFFPGRIQRDNWIEQAKELVS